ncbi:hypothetical protein PIB30_019410 [Stylosanthes scabra]|uniref:Ubiquitin-like protease family profile domain-containing protein n=1 Tax=Stylosanthes scabra TaxID=79078 RepID=A0ABU6Q830_9FABA|nr:hypothetical protein [Stylosanthes scabra]
MLYKWATEGEEDIMYEFLFKFMTGKTFEAVREHFMSLAKEAEMDLVYHMLQKYHHTYLNTETGRPYELSTMENDNDLEYIVKDKMKKAHYNKLSTLIISMDFGLILLTMQLFAPVLYGHHWWLYVFDVKKRKFYVLDSLNPKTTGSIEYPGSNDGLCWGGTMFPGPITPQVASHSLLPKYIRVPKQINQFYCGVYVLKYLEMVNPTELGKKTYKIPPWSEDELAEFREQIAEYILLHHDNFYRTKAVEALEPRQRTSRPSHALQSPYMQLNSSDLESGNAKHKKK